MIFFTLLYLSFISGPWSTLAFPTNLPLAPRNHLQSIFVRGDENRLDFRSIYGILWSCLSTIFTCTWIAVHPNIPAPGDSRWAVLRRRVAIMGFVLLAPEMVIIWAGRQHFAARHFAKKYQGKNGWTRTHAFFLIMGGFILHERGKAVRILEAEDLEELSEAGKIDWPTITEEEIADRSKGDYLSKTIVLFQTTWFIGQCIARGAYKLALTELEVVTLAFAILTGVIYYLWWDKPLDVNCSIPVQLIEGHSEKIEDDVRRRDAGAQSPVLPIAMQLIEGRFEELGNDVEKQVAGSQSPVSSIPMQRIEGSSEKPGDDLERHDAGSRTVSFPQISNEGSPERNEKTATLPNPLPSAQIQGDNTTPDPALTQMQRLQAFIRRACVKHGTILGLGYALIIFPILRFFGPFGDMMHCKALGDKTLRVPTFYSPTDETDKPAGRIGLCVSIVFGAIHCIAWSFHFATLQERWAWRISAILISSLPIVIIALLLLLAVFDEENRNMWIEVYENFLAFVVVTLTCLYIFVRMTLLVLPFVALRALPPDTYVALNWISFLPHI